MIQKSRLGDLFEVRLDESVVRFFQYVANDETQLDSNVVRVFRETYSPNTSTSARIVAAGEVDFHAHVFLSIGTKQGLWRKAGHAEPPDNIEVLFRDSDDYGNPEVQISRSWFVWKPNSRAKSIGRLGPRYEHAEIGVVVPPDSLVYRMRNGAYDFVYPDY